MQNENKKNASECGFSLLLKLFLIKKSILISIVVLSGTSLYTQTTDTTKQRIATETPEKKLDEAVATVIVQDGGISMFLCGDAPPYKTQKVAITKSGDCGEDIENAFDAEYLKNCYYNDRISGHAITPRYMVDYDQRTGRITYLKLKNAKGREYLKIKKQLRPWANTEMQFRIVAKGGDYKLLTQGGDYFMEYEAAFAQNIQNAKSDTSSESKSSGEKSNVKKDSTKLVENNSTELEIGLSSLQLALYELNNRYPVNALIEGGYYRDLRCLRFGISQYFKIIILEDSLNVDGFTREAGRLADSLKLQVPVDEKKDSLDAVIQSIAAQYYTFISKQLFNYKVYHAQIQVPDQDFFDLSMRNVATDKDAGILNRHFRVSGGFKIDFSAGVFLTGLSVPEFVAQPHTYKYRPVTFLVDPVTGQVDTTFTGTLRDTTGNLIHTKNPRMNYAAGFLLHAYTRSGIFANCGITTGLLVNNDGFQMLLGGSTLFNIRKSRIAFSGGMAIGKQKTLSPTVENSVWKDSYVEGMIDNLPPFFAGSDVPYFEKWRTSWYFGLTYNFNSVAIRW